MNIHVVQQGETIYFIANRYSVSVMQLIQDNGLNVPYTLVVGQAIMIVYPEQTYVVKTGDSLIAVANMNGISLMQLLRNNPFLSDRKTLYPGETLVISYKNKNKKITINGYAYPFIDKAILRKTLPFLTYVTVFNYRAMPNGDIIGNDDSEILQISKAYGVAPIMQLSTLTTYGSGSMETAYNILYNEQIVDRFINNILNLLRTKGYYGLNVTFQFINAENRHIYDSFITKLSNRLNQEGYPVFVTLTPRTFISTNEITFEAVDYTVIGQKANGVILLSYDWGYSFGPPISSSAIFIQSNLLDYVVKIIQPEKIFLGISIIGYDWKLPYEIGVTKANSLTTDSAITLAEEVGAVIQFDEASKSPFFKYLENSKGVPSNHIVWFDDVRSIGAMLELIQKYRFPGAAIWNIMNFFSQLWVSVNSQYEIEKVIDVPVEKP